MNGVNESYHKEEMQQFIDKRRKLNNITKKKTKETRVLPFNI